MPTKIEWCDVTWSPVTGCSSISEGCQNCYAKKMAQRFKGRFGYPRDDPFKPTIHLNRMERYPRSKNGGKRIFVSSMGDLFHDKIMESKESLYSERLFATHLDILNTVNCCKEDTFIFLTKRPENMKIIINHWGRFIKTYYMTEPFHSPFLTSGLAYR